MFRIDLQMKVYKHKIVARFGLMHMVGTNLSVWLNVLVQETKHEILTFYDPENKTIGLQHRLGKYIYFLLAVYLPEFPMGNLTGTLTLKGWNSENYPL